MCRLLVGTMIGLCFSCGNEANRSASESALAKLAQLHDEPHLVPAPMEEHESAVVVLLGVDKGGRALVDGSPMLVSSADMRLPRAMAKRRTKAPHFWVMVRQPDAETVRYWTPIEQQSMIRANVSDPESKLHSPELRAVPTDYSAVRLPFFPRAELEFVDPEGRSAGTYRFGDQPTDPLLRVQ